MKFINGGVCAPKGFLAAGIHCGLKRKRFKQALAIVFSEVPAVAAGVFTKNKIQAACITITKRRLKDNRAQAIIANSGNANCCTGKAGIKDAGLMAEITARALGISPQDVLVASTGKIGSPLPMEMIINAVPSLVKRLGRFKNIEAAKAIMTTDTVPKETAVRFSINGRPVTIGGAAKGAGMIHPNMATMLCFITTDAKVTPQVLKTVLKKSVDRSFNSISIDADTSTNDMVLILANSAALNPLITPRTKASLDKFSKALHMVTEDLAKKIVRDGEGATKFIEVTVKGARTDDDALCAARAICNSPLIKTAMYGNDANWGRIAAAVGASGASVRQERLSIYLNNIALFKKGQPVKDIDESRVRRSIQGKDISIVVELGLGSASKTMWTCDFSHEYVDINARYRT